GARSMTSSSHPTTRARPVWPRSTSRKRWPCGSPASGCCRCGPPPTRKAPSACWCTSTTRSRRPTTGGPWSSPSTAFRESDMPLPTVTLDDRHFQDIVDQTKTLIPHYCPEWTDHNVSDPGVALIELFAWMTDLLLYRVNQTPDKMYVKFLELIGVRLELPRAARSPITFYLSAAQPAEVTIPENTEVATVRTENSPAILFSTETDLTIRTAVLVGAFTRDVERRGEGEWEEHDLTQMDLPGARVQVFAGSPNPGDAFYLAFKNDLSHHLLALMVECELAGGAGVDPTQPPIQWEAWQGGSVRWAPCEVERDGPGGFNWSGEILLHLPAMARVSFREVPAYWLRCRMVEAKPGTSTYEISPELERLRLE